MLILFLLSKSAVIFLGFHLDIFEQVFELLKIFSIILRRLICPANKQKLFTATNNKTNIVVQNKYFLRHITISLRLGKSDYVFPQGKEQLNYIISQLHFIRSLHFALNLMISKQRKSRQNFLSILYPGIIQIHQSNYNFNSHKYYYYNNWNSNKKTYKNKQNNVAYVNICKTDVFFFCAST